MAERLTPREEEAIRVALSASLASPVLDGFEEDSDEEMAVRRAMSMALTKLYRRQEIREARR